MGIKKNRSDIPDKHLSLISIIENHGYIVMRWQPEGIYRVISANNMIRWNIDTGVWRDVDCDMRGYGIKSLINFLEVNNNE